MAPLEEQAIGKTSKPLKIGVLVTLREWEEIKRLEEQGHTIVFIDDPELTTCDVILGPQCHVMDVVYRKYFQEAIDETRRRLGPERWKRADA